MVVTVKPVDGAAPAAAEPIKPAGKPAARPLVPPKAPASSKRQTKVLLSVTDGKIEWEKMEGGERKKFEALFADPEFLKQFGLTPKDGAFDPQQVAMLYDAVSIAYATIFKFLAKWPPAALQLLAYTKEQKEMLAKPTATLLNKFAPSILMQNQELFVFGTIFLATTQGNFAKAKAAAAEIKQQELEKRKAAAASQANSPHGTVVPPAKGANGHAEKSEGEVTIIPPAFPLPINREVFGGR